MSELDRILAIPKAKTPDLDRAIDKWTLRLRRHKHARPLRPIQALALEMLHQNNGTHRGLWGSIGVGHGKTLISLLAPMVVDARKPPKTLLLAPPDMKSQLAKDVREWRKDYYFPEPNFVSYAKLSQPDATAFLRKMRPRLVIMDECQNLQYRGAARTKRVIRYFRAHPETRCIAMSGTVTSRSIREYAHLIELALREHAPLPLNFDDLAVWSSVLDPGSEPNQSDLNHFWGLVTRTLGKTRWELLDERERKKVAQKAFAKRYLSTPGVVATNTQSTSAPLTLAKREFKASDVVNEAITRLEDSWELPNGDEIVSALQFHSAALHLSSGFYYRQEWPNNEPDTEWLEARRDWHRFIRQYLKKHSREGLDSPGLLDKACREGRTNPEAREIWTRWQAVKGRVGPATVPEYLDPSLVVDGLQRALQEPRCLIWYRYEATRLLLEDMGFQTFGAGSKAPPDSVAHPCVSVNVHRKGKNLQAWTRNIILESPTNGKWWEQLLGRTHRQGQKEPVQCIIYDHTWPLRRAVQQGRAHAKYIERTQRTPMKLNHCKWDVDRT